MAWLDRRLYPASVDHWDDEIFRRWILDRLRPGVQVLDLGAGVGFVKQMDFRRHGARIVGIDVDERVMANPYLDEAHVARGETLPFGDSTFDVVFSDNVLEHLTDPVAVFREVRRVLKPGGVYLVKTPNRRHYMPLIALATPLWFHRWVNHLRGRPPADTFPTRYLVNTPARIRSVGREADLEVEEIELIEGRPEYLRLSAATYLLGWLYERAVNRIPKLAAFRILLVARLRRPPSPNEP